MAEPARAIMTGDIVRVRIRIANPARAHELANLLRELGHITDSADADVTLTDAESSGLHLVGEDASNARGVLPADASPRQIDAALRAVASGLGV